MVRRGGGRATAAIVPAGRLRWGLLVGVETVQRALLAGHLGSHPQGAGGKHRQVGDLLNVALAGRIHWTGGWPLVLAAAGLQCYAETGPGRAPADLGALMRGNDNHG